MPNALSNTMYFIPSIITILFTDRFWGGIVYHKSTLHHVDHKMRANIQYAPKLIQISLFEKLEFEKDVLLCESVCGI